jgi:hypothetical protein
VDEPVLPEIAPAAAPGQAGKARPLAGPVISLTSEISNESDALLGGNARSKITDAVATKVLVNGEAMPVPAGRADDFTWPRRTVAPLGADPVVATTDLPMTPMVADRGAAPGSATAAGATAVAAAAPVAQRAPARIRAAEYRQYRPARQQQFNFFPFLFGGGMFGGGR